MSSLRTARGHRRSRWLSAVLGLVVAVSLTGGTVPAAAESAGVDEAAPAWSPDVQDATSEGDIQARMLDELVTRDEAIRRFDVERSASALQQEVQSRWPATFAGLWIDQSPFSVSVAFTRDAAENVESLKPGFPYPDDLRAVTAARSMQTLTSLQQRMGQDRAALQDGQRPEHLPPVIHGTRGVYDLDIDVPAAEVVVRVAQASEDTRQAFQDAYSPAVTVQEGLAEPTTCQITDCRYAMMGGLKLNRHRQLGTAVRRSMPSLRLPLDTFCRPGTATRTPASPAAATPVATTATHSDG